MEKAPLGVALTKSTTPTDLEKVELHDDVYGSEPSLHDQPTDEERHSLRRVSDKIPLKAYTIGFVELVERLSYYGTTAVFVNFIQKPNPGTATGRAVDPGSSQAQPGALGYGQQASFGLTTFNQFWVYLIPLFGAYVADTYLGRYKTVLISIFIAIVGHVILTASAAPSVIETPKTALGVFVVGLIIMGIGTGGFKPNISPLVAEQVPNRMHVRTEKNGERVLVDPAVTLSRTYNYFYLFINIGALVGQIGMVYAERYVGFYLSFLIPTIAFCLTPLVMIFGRKIYKEVPPQGSVLLPAVKLLMLGTKGRWHLNPVATYKHMNDGTFWESVKPSTYANGARPKWMDFDDMWVEEVRRGWAAVSVFCYFPLYWLT
jgi:POT family proton-dependent oligopeptide transporter